MKFQEIKKYLGFVWIIALLILLYKTFDNFGAVIDFFGKLLHILMPFIIGGVIAFILCRPCRKFEILLRLSKVPFLKKYRRPLAVLCTYLIVILTLALIVTAIVPQISESIARFTEQLPQLAQSFVLWLNSMGVSIDMGNITLSNIFDNPAMTEIIDFLDLNNINKYFSGIKTVGTSLFKFLLGIIVSVYILLGRTNIKRYFNKLTRAYITEKPRNTIYYYGRKISDFINKYIGCQILDACIVFILCLIALSIMQTPYAAVFALMVGFFNLIPYFGAIIAVTIACLVTLLTSGFTTAIVLLVVLLVIQQIDANIIQPRLVASSLDIKPLLVILGVTLGSGFFGVFGMFIGVPVVALVKSIVDDIIERRLENKKADA